MEENALQGEVFRVYKLDAGETTEDMKSFVTNQKYRCVEKASGRLSNYQSKQPCCLSGTGTHRKLCCPQGLSAKLLTDGKSEGEGNPTFLWRTIPDGRCVYVQNYGRRYYKHCKGHTDKIPIGIYHYCQPCTQYGN